MRHTIKRPEQKTIVNRAVRSGEIRIELAEISQKARKGILTPAETQRFRALQAEKKRLQQNQIYSYTSGLDVPSTILTFVTVISKFKYLFWHNILLRGYMHGWTKYG